MAQLPLVAYFLGGLSLSNGIPHFVNGAMGRPFQTPFAKPSGKGLSTSTANVLWGFFNFALAYVLLCRVGEFDLHSTPQVATAGLGFVTVGVFGGRHFGRFHGGNLRANCSTPQNADAP